VNVSAYLQIQISGGFRLTFPFPSLSATSHAAARGSRWLRPALLAARLGNPPALLCGALPWTGGQGGAEEPPANRREVQKTLDLDGKCCELTQGCQIQTQPNLTLAHPHVRTHMHPRNEFHENSPW